LVSLFTLKSKKSNYLKINLRGEVSPSRNPGRKQGRYSAAPSAEVRGDACLALLSRRSRTPATLSFGRKNVSDNNFLKEPSLSPLIRGRRRRGIRREIQQSSHLSCSIFFHVFSTLIEGVAGGGERLPSGKHSLPLPQEGVCQRPRSPALRARRLWPGGTAAGGSPTKGINRRPTNKPFDCKGATIVYLNSLYSAVR